MNVTLEATGRPAEILHVDDQTDYAELLREGFEMSKLAVNLHHAKDGEECMTFLHKDGQHAGAPTPDIILLDLNMPRMDGKEVLAAISRDDRLRHLPVVILTSSGEDREILEMYRLRCSSYIVKPLDFQELIRFIKSFADFWLSVAVLPGRKDLQRLHE